MEKFYNDVEVLTKRFKELGYTEDQALELLRIYFSLKPLGAY